MYSKSIVICILLVSVSARAQLGNCPDTTTRTATETTTVTTAEQPQTLSDPAEADDLSAKPTQDQGVATSGLSGLTTSPEPTWAFISDANVSSIDTSKLAVGFGLERATPFTLSHVILKVQTDQKIEAAVRSVDIGRVVLAPGLADYSFSVREEYRPWAWMYGCKDTQTKKNRIYTKISHGFYGALEIARVDVAATKSDGSMITGPIYPMALGAGYMARIEGQLPDSFNIGGNQAVFAPYVGAAYRVVGDDLGNANRSQLFGTGDRYLIGFEAGIVLQLGNFLFEPKGTALTNFSERVYGASGLKFQATLSYVLSVGGTAKSTQPKAGS